MMQQNKAVFDVNLCLLVVYKNVNLRKHCVNRL